MLLLGLGIGCCLAVALAYKVGTQSKPNPRVRPPEGSTTNRWQRSDTGL